MNLHVRKVATLPQQLTNLSIALSLFQSLFASVNGQCDTFLNNFFFIDSKFSGTVESLPWQGKNKSLRLGVVGDKSVSGIQTRQ